MDLLIFSGQSNMQGQTESLPPCHVPLSCDQGGREMNKHFAAFFAERGLTVTGNRAYGVINGYETNIVLNSLGTVPYFHHISFFATDEQKRNMAAALRSAALKFFTPQFTPYGFAFGMNDLTIKRLLKRLPSVYEYLYGLIAANGGLGAGYCPVCGNKLNLSDCKVCDIDHLSIRLDSGCIQNINAVISEENKDFENAPNNYGKGLFGAVLGGLAGAVCSVLLYLVGFVSALSSMVSVLLGAFLYQKFEGKPNKAMIVIVAVTTLIFMEATVLGIYITVAGIAARSAGHVMSALDAFRLCMTEGEFARAFYLDLVLALIFAAVGIGVEVTVLARKIKRRANIR